MPQLFLLVVVVDESLGRFAVVDFDCAVLGVLTGFVPRVGVHVDDKGRVLRIRKSLV